MAAGGEHEFGGAWTQIKLDMLAKYLRFYASALKNRAFQKWYIDGFAGSGSRTTRRPGQAELPLFGEVAGPDSTEENAGSAKLALEVQPPFDRYIFIEQHQGRFAALSALAKEHPACRTEFRRGDANAEIREICQTTPWMKWPGVRAVMFLDPYGMTVDWTTLEAIAATKAVDVWYLFPVLAICRQAARDPAKVDEAKSAALTRVLGTDEWKTEFYLDYLQPSLGDIGTEVPIRAADLGRIQAWMKQRLGALFPECSDPLPLPFDGGPQQFSLFFTVSNPRPEARALAMKVAAHILNAGRSSHKRPR